MIKVGIIGVTGYTGIELLRILMGHGEVEVAAVSSVSFEGKPVYEVYPQFLGLCNLVCDNKETVIDKSDVIFACLPHGLSEEIAKLCVNKGKKLIDLGADFRLYFEKDYEEWYEKKFDEPVLHGDSVYLIPELFKNELKNQSIIANPGCYPTAVCLGLAPAIYNACISNTGIIIDAKSGVTGAGRSLSQRFHFAECNEAFGPYKVATHRHTPEIEQSLSYYAGAEINITFVPHLLPINRGIICTMYSKIKKDVSFKKIRKHYEKFYKIKPFVRVLPDGQTADLKNVRYTNLCDISLHFDSRTGTFVVVSAIDNMVKGAAGQAVQNMNILMGIEETTGLNFIPPTF